jgi:hypothetical protein
MILRVFALYGRNFVLLGGLFLLWAGQIAAGSVGLASGVGMYLP